MLEDPQLSQPLNAPKRLRIKKRSGHSTILGRFFVKIPMVTKLMVCTLFVLVIGLVGISLSIRQLVRNYLIGKTDLQLVEQAELVYNNIGFLKSKDKNSTAGPNDYFLQIRDKRNTIISTPLIPVLKSGVVAEPLLPANGQRGNVKIGKPFTARSIVIQGAVKAERSTLQAASEPWRVIALEWEQKSPVGTNAGGVLYIGLSLGYSIDVVNTLTRYTAIVSAIAVTLGGLIALVLIRSTLSPLQRIEKTAASIAAGDLSRRVDAAPENTEIGSLSASINSMLSKIEESFKQQERSTEKMKRFVSDASHELRTPLAAIHGYSELYFMQRNLPGALERADESIRHIEDSSSRMTILVNDLLSLARLDEGRGISRNQRVELGEILRSSGDDLHALDPQRDITLQTIVYDPELHTEGFSVLDHELPCIWIKKGDITRLRQVITNIIGNIHRYTPTDSPVEIGLGKCQLPISIEQLEQWPCDSSTERMMFEALKNCDKKIARSEVAIIRVVDHGPGVPIESQGKIFERFYTADASRARQKGGTGLGMAIVHSIVKAHHGVIFPATTPGGGLTLRIVLPIEDEGHEV